MIKITKQQAALYKKKWENIEEFETRELQAMPFSLKFQQLCVLMNSFGAVYSDREQKKEVGFARDRWMRLKKRSKNADS